MCTVYKSTIHAITPTRMATNVYKDVMKEAFHEATPEVVKRFRTKMGFIQERYSHTAKTVQSCLHGLSEKPTLVELLVAAYLVNGGVLFKYNTEELSQEEVEGDNEYSRLLKEMDDLGCTSSSPATKHNIDDIFVEHNETD